MENRNFWSPTEIVPIKSEKPEKLFGKLVECIVGSPVKIVYAKRFAQTWHNRSTYKEVYLPLKQGTTKHKQNLVWMSKLHAYKCDRPRFHKTAKPISL